MEQLPLWSGADAAGVDRIEPIPMENGVVRVGTCGYSYRDWIGNFYPPGVRPGKMLDYYASRFVTVEIDSSYYRIPSEAAIESMHRRTPEEFRFTAKAPGSLTHVPADADNVSLEDAPVFRERLAPLVEAGKLGAVLLQFPNSFRPGKSAEQHLGRLRDALPDLPLVAEFRHREWQSDATIALLGTLDIGWCNVDEPGFQTLLRPSSDVVGNLAYVRFHGRNAKTWWKGDGAERYHYSYTPQELEPWAARVADMASAARETYVFFNNHRFGHAASNADLFAHILRGD
jgi:uncharacterized protein YecE (DUF72 family)